MQITKEQVIEGVKIPRFYLRSEYDFIKDSFYCDLFFIAIPKIIFKKLQRWYLKTFRFNSYELELRRSYEQGHWKGFVEGRKNTLEEIDKELLRIAKK